MKSTAFLICIAAGLGLIVTTQSKSDELAKDATPSKQDSRDKLIGKEAGLVRDDNGVKMKLVWCPPGEFKMENPKVVVARAGDDTRKEDGWEDADLKPGRRWKRFFIPVKVSLTHGYWLGKYEVTQSEWGQVMKTDPWRQQRYLAEGWDYPATNVSWYEAREFCRKLTEQERQAGRLPDNWGYMLPTEAQWENACRAGTETPFSFGADERQLGEYAWFSDNTWKVGQEYAHRVGEKKSNPWGLCDMHGNVCEWCRDVSTVDLPGGRDPETKSDSQSRSASREMRGGSWLDRTEACRSGYRSGGAPRSAGHSLGFRVALCRDAGEFAEDLLEREKAEATQQSSAKSLGKSVLAEKNSVGMEFLLIPPGKFTMGSPEPELDRHRDEAQVEVTLTRGFYLAKTEVTQGQWRAVMGSTPWKGKRYVREQDNCSATFVSWDDAQAFCKKLSQAENVPYRLPTEAEWEYACRGGTTTRYSFRNDEAALSDHAWWRGIVGEGNVDGELYAHEVGRKRANPFGLYDMHGNVFEWCEDVYVDQLPGGTDPLVSAGGNYRVNRGGSWFRAATHCRCAARGESRGRSHRTYDLGFRVARSAQ